MGGKSSKAKRASGMGGKMMNGHDDADETAQHRHSLQLQIDSALERKRPTSRRIADLVGSAPFMPAYALETLDEDSVVVVRNSFDSAAAAEGADGPQATKGSDLKRHSTADSDDGAIVYVFNPDRVVSTRVSKRMSVADETLIMERMSQSADRFSRMSSQSRLSAQSATTSQKHKQQPAFSMVISARERDLADTKVRSVDCCVVGRTGSSNADPEARALCQDEAHFEVAQDAVVFGVFDGHGPDGHIVSALCAKELVSCVVDDQSFYWSQSNAVEAIKGGIASLELRIKEIPPRRCDIEHSGTTATIGYVIPGTTKVVIANVGDSRCIGARKDAATNKLALVKLSEEHILSNPAEKERIEKAGGRVSPYIIDGREIGPPRCWFNYENADLPGLMVSRTLGDTIARSIGVNTECSVYEAEGLAFLIMASDGLWEVMTSEEAIGFVGGAVATMSHPNAKNSPLTLSELLCMEAKRRWMNLESKVNDDISACVVVFA